MEFDAFDQGIELGGLRNREEIRLLICYLLKTLDKPIEKARLNDAVLENGLANYFEINSAISELLSNACIDTVIEDEEECLVILPRGKEIADNLETSLPKTVRERAVNSAVKIMTNKKAEKENNVLIEKTEDGGYNVTFSLMSDKDELMRLTVYVADSMQAELLKKNYLEDPIKLYSSIITALTVD